MKSPEQIKTELMTVKPGTPEEMKLLGEHRAYSAMNRENPQPLAAANAQTMIDTAEHEIVQRQHEAEAGHAAHLAVHAVVQGGNEQAQHIEVHRA